MRVLVIEDDPMQSEMILSALQATFEGVELRHAETESEVTLNLPEIGRWCPDLIVLDMMLPWSLPEPDAPSPPPDVMIESYRYAGRRILKKLRDYEPTSVAPVLFFTVLGAAEAAIPDDPDAPPTLLLGKDSGIAQVMTYVRSLVPSAVYKAKAPSSLLDKVLSATEAKPRIFGFSIDLKKLLPKPNEA